MINSTFKQGKCFIILAGWFTLLSILIILTIWHQFTAKDTIPPVSNTDYRIMFPASTYDINSNPNADPNLHNNTNHPSNPKSTYNSLFNSHSDKLYFSQSDWSHYRASKPYGVGFPGHELGAPFLYNNINHSNPNMIAKNILWCPIAKCGSETWRTFWYRYVGESSRKSSTFRLYEYPNIKTININKDFLYAFVIIRDPLERILSGYLDKCFYKSLLTNPIDYAAKFCFNKRNYQYILELYSNYTTKNDINRLNNNEKEDILRYIFELFGGNLVEILAHYGWESVNAHWMPMYLFCDLYKHVEYYNLYKMNSIDDTYKIINQLGFWDEYYNESLSYYIGNKGKEWVWGLDNQTRWNWILSLSHLTRHGKVVNHANDKVLRYYSVRMIHILIDLYKMDYIVFNITIPQWICQVIENEFKNSIGKSVDRILDKNLTNSVIRQSKILVMDIFNTFDTSLIPKCLYDVSIQINNMMLK